MGGVLSQQKEGKLHPCALFLSPSQNEIMMYYDELLAIKLALEEWRYWPEGPAQPFIVWMDHKNLAYLQVAKRYRPAGHYFSLALTSPSPTGPGHATLSLMCCHASSPHPRLFFKFKSQLSFICTTIFKRSNIKNDVPFPVEG